MKDFESKLQQALIQLASQPDNSVLYNYIGNLYRALKNFDQAVNYYQKAIELNADYAEAYNNLGVLFTQTNRIQDALKYYVQALKIDPAYVTTHRNLGRLFLKTQQYKEARIQFNNVLSLVESDLEAYYQLGNLDLMDNNLSQAEVNYQNVLLLDEEHIDTLNNLGVIRVKQARAQEAIDYFSKALALNNKNTEVLSNLAGLFLQHDRYENAVAHYRELLKLTPEDLEMHFNMGVALMAMGHLKEAVTHYQKVLSKQPNNIETLGNVAAVYLRLGEIKEAVTYFKRALELNPDDPVLAYQLAAITGENLPIRTPKEYITRLFDRYAIHFDQHLLKRLEYRVPELLHAALKNITQISSNLNILDLGCGTGLSGEYFKQYAKNLIGIDLSEKMLQMAEKKDIYDELIHDNLENYLNNTKITFDLIIAADVLGYIGDLENLFKLIKQKLRPNGSFVFSIEPADKTKKQDFYLQKNVRFAHQKTYIQKLAEKNNLSIKSCEKQAGRIQEDQSLDVFIFVLQA